MGPGIASASIIATSCAANGDGSIGSTVIQGGVLNGQPFGNDPAPNTVVPVPGIGTVTLNEQVRSDVAGSATITITGAHARYDGGTAVAPDPLGAEAIIAQVTCQVTGSDVLSPPTTQPPTTQPPTTTTTVAPASTTPTTIGLARTAAELADSGAESLLAPALMLLGLAFLVRRAARPGRRPDAIPPDG